MRTLTITDDETEETIISIKLEKKTDTSKTAQAILKAVDGLKAVRAPRGPRKAKASPAAITPPLPGV